MPGRLQLKLAAEILDEGGVIAYPTEAVFGLGCDPHNSEAVTRLLNIKQRPINKGLILIASDFNQLTPYIDNISAEAMAKVQSSWPGPYTWIFPKASDTPYWLTGDHDGVAVRVTAHPIAARLCEAFGGAIVSTSANHHEKQACRSALRVRNCLGDQVDYILSGEVDRHGKPTQIKNAITGEVIRN